MTMQKLSYALLLAAIAAPYAQAEGWYGSAKLNSARQQQDIHRFIRSGSYLC